MHFTDSSVQGLLLLQGQCLLEQGWWPHQGPWGQWGLSALAMKERKNVMWAIVT